MIRQWMIDHLVLKVCGLTSYKSCMNGTSTASKLEAAESPTIATIKIVVWGRLNLIIWLAVHISTMFKKVTR